MTDLMAYLSRTWKKIQQIRIAYRPLLGKCTNSRKERPFAYINRQTDIDLSKGFTVIDLVSSRRDPGSYERSCYWDDYNILR